MNADTMVRLLIVDDHGLFRAGLRQLLEARPGLQIAGEAASAEQAFQVLRTTEVDVVLLDISLPTLNGIAALDALWKVAPKVKVLILSTHKDPEYVARALAKGVAGYLLKESSSADEVALAARAAMRGDTFVSPSLTHLLITPFVREADPGEPMTVRQRQVLVLLAQGLSVKQAAGRLNLSVKTVETHRAVLMDRLGLGNVASLVLYAVRNGLISAGEGEPPVGGKRAPGRRTDSQ